jgi:hypothetical protein
MSALRLYKDPFELSLLTISKSRGLRCSYRYNSKTEYQVGRWVGIPKGINTPQQDGKPSAMTTNRIQELESLFRK